MIHFKKGKEKRKSFSFSEQPEFIKYGSPLSKFNNHNSETAGYKTMPTRACRGKMSDLDKGRRWRPSNPDSSHKGIQQSIPASPFKSSEAVWL